MENLFFFLANNVLRLTKPRFKRYLLTTYGCSALLVNDNPVLHSKRTKDGDRILFYEQVCGESIYGMVTVKMKDVVTLDGAETILVQYISRIRKPLGIAFNTGMQIEKSTNQLFISDYWQDDNGVDWKLRGCTNGKIINLAYVKNINATAVNEHDAFLNGFRFSAFS